MVCGYLDRAFGAAMGVDRLGRPKGSPTNAAAVLHRGQVVGRYAKHHLPNYGVFDEFRHFVPGDTLLVVRVHGVDVAITICEDLWQEGGPVAATREAGAGLLLVINSSPYEANKDDQRGDLVRRRAREAGCALAYVNLVGGQDELVFDGDSLIVDAAGEIVARAPQFDDGGMVVDLDLPAASEPPPAEGAGDGDRARGDPPGPAAAVRAAAARARAAADRRGRGLRGDGDRAARLRRQERLQARAARAVRAVSTPCLAATIACDAIGAENVHGISMPERVLLRALQGRCRRARGPDRAELPGDPDPADGASRSWTRSA